MKKEQYKFESSFLKKSLQYTVITTNENESDAYILYVQDGNDYLQLGHFEEKVQQLQKQLQLNKRLIFVFIHPGDSIERWNSYHSKGELFEQYIKFMIDEFIPTFESKLSGINVEKRGLLGDSLAANISLNIAMKDPSKFTHLLLQSAAISEDELDRMEKLEDVNWSVYQFVGTKEDEFISPITNEKLWIYSRNQQLRKVFLNKEIELFYKEERVEHLWVVWEKDLAHVLLYFLQG